MICEPDTTVKSVVVLLPIVTFAPVSKPDPGMVICVIMPEAGVTLVTVTAVSAHRPFYSPCRRLPKGAEKKGE